MVTGFTSHGLHSSRGTSWKMAVATITKTLAVNPAFLQEIKDCNPDLWQAVDQLAGMRLPGIDEHPGQTLRRLTRLLDQLRDQVALQFALEESYGYLEVPAHISRVTCRLAGDAQAQHSTLYLRLSELAEQAEELQYRGLEMSRLRELVDASLQFVAELQQHEQLEQELIHRSYDLG